MSVVKIDIKARKIPPQKVVFICTYTIYYQ